MLGGAVAGAVVGGLFSGGAELAGQVFGEGRSLDCIDWGRVGRAAGEGALLGAISGGLGLGPIGDFALGFVWDISRGRSFGEALVGGFLSMGIGAGTDGLLRGGEALARALRHGGIGHVGRSIGRGIGDAMSGGLGRAIGDGVGGLGRSIGRSIREEFANYRTAFRQFGAEWQTMSAFGPGFRSPRGDGGGSQPELPGMPQRPIRPVELIPGELDVNEYGRLIRLNPSGSGLEAHHVPSDS
jgi:hypothetical protein